MSIVLNLHQVSVRYQQSLLFSPISCTLSRGELLCLQGGNGVGKTSLLKSIAGLHSHIVGDFQRVECLSVGWLGHSLAVKSYFTGLEQLQAWAALEGNPLNSPLEKLEKVGLKSARNKRIQTYSAGMQRRLAMAGLLAREAELWILDEPQTHLDAAGVDLMQDLMKAFLDEGGAILMSSHLQLRNDLPVQFIPLESV